jgi:serine/threonine protein kinase
MYVNSCRASTGSVKLDTLSMSCTPESRLGQYLDGHLQLTGILGVGAYGVVYTAVDIYSFIPYAIKALSKVGLEPAQRLFQEREIELHRAAQCHPNVVSLVEILEAPDCVYVVMEYCSEGDLFSAITENGHYVGDDVLAKSVFLQLLDAVEFCHSIGIYHRDLKPENVLVANSGQVVKLGDFGLATTEPFTSDFGCGSTFYMSPECQVTKPSSSFLKHRKRYASAPNDVWSLGVILINLTCGRNPWKRASASLDETYNAFVQNPLFLRSILPISTELEAVLLQIFDRNPCTRISLPDLRQAIMRCERLTVYSPDDMAISPQTPISMDGLTVDGEWPKPPISQPVPAHTPYAPQFSSPILQQGQFTFPATPQTPFISNTQTCTPPYYSQSTSKFTPHAYPEQTQIACPPTPESPIWNPKSLIGKKYRTRMQVYNANNSEPSVNPSGKSEQNTLTLNQTKGYLTDDEVMSADVDKRQNRRDAFQSLVDSSAPSPLLLNDVDKHRSAVQTSAARVPVF